MSTSDSITKVSYIHLTASQRGKISLLLKQGASKAEIARQLGVHRSTITRDIKRGSVKQVKDVSGKLVYYGAYFDETAQILAKKRHQTVYFLKLEQVSTNFLTAFTKAMKAKPRSHSVDIFVHDYMKLHPDEVVPSTKTMYTYIHQGLLDVKPIDLPRAMRLRPRTKKRPSMTVLSLVIGLKTAGEPSILTLVERQTRYAITVYLAGKKAEYVNVAVAELIKQYPITSITADNGSEFASLSDLKGVQVYYAHTYSSYERGTNEHFNGLLREFIPKGQSLKVITAEATSDIKQRPRRLLGYQGRKLCLRLFNKSQLFERFSIYKLSYLDLTIR